MRRPVNYLMPYNERSTYGVVVIGRNEGERLKQCLNSVAGSECTVYVDSGSTGVGRMGQGSRRRGRPTRYESRVHCGAGAQRWICTAAGISAATGIRSVVQFVDGDCELRQEWPRHAIAFLRAHGQVCAVFGRRRERYPDRSIVRIR